MVDVNESLTRKVADLAKLQLSDDEVRIFTGQLGSILEYVQQLTTVDLKGPDGKDVEPLTHPLELETPMRSDEARASPVDQDGKPKMLTAAPNVANDSFKVPPIL